MFKRIASLCVMLFVLLASAISYAAPKTNPDDVDPKLRARLVSAILSNEDYKGIVGSMRTQRVSADPSNVAIELGGESPDGTLVYTVAMGTNGATKNTAKAILAFVEVPKAVPSKETAPKEVAPNVIAVGLVSISEEDGDGNRNFEISGPGRKTIESKYDPRTGAKVGSSPSGSSISTQALTPCVVTCFVAEVVACTSVCGPLALVTGGIGGWICSTACGAVFTWTCSYCP